MPSFEVIKKQRQEEFEALKKRQDEVDLEAYLASFKKDRLGAVTLIVVPKMPFFIIDSDKPSVSNSLFTPDQIVEIQYDVTCGTAHVYDLIAEHDLDRKNMPQSEPSASLPVSQPSVNMPVSYKQDSRLVTSLPCPTPLKSVPFLTLQPSQAVHYPGQETAPNPSLAPWSRVEPMGNTSDEG